MTIAFHVPDLTSYYRWVKRAATAARSVAGRFGAKALPPASAPAVEVGRADQASIAVERGYVHGWLVDANGAEAKPLRIFLDGRLAGVATANVPVPKIGRRFKLPTVRHGFRFPIPPQARDGASHAVAVQTLDKRTRRTVRFAVAPDDEGPRIELLGLSESGLTGVLRNGYDAGEGPELWIGDRKLVWPRAVTRLSPRDDLATSFAIALLKPEMSELLAAGLRIAVPGGREIGVTTAIVELLCLRVVRSAPNRLSVVTALGLPRLDGVSLRVEFSAQSRFAKIGHSVTIDLIEAAAEVALPAELAIVPLWARLVMLAGGEITAGEPVHVRTFNHDGLALGGFDPADAGAAFVMRDPPSGEILVAGVHVRYDESAAETCVLALSGASADGPARLTCDALASGAGVRLCFSIPLEKTQAGDRMRLSFSARARPSETARGVAFSLMSSRGPALVQAREAALDRMEPDADGWMRRDIPLTLGRCSRDDMLDLVMDIEPGAGVEVSGVSARLLGPAPDLAVYDGPGGRKIRVDTGARIVGAAWLDGAVVAGWAVDSADPQRPVMIELLVDGAVVAAGLATDAHPVLTGRDHNFGRCAFRIPAPVQLRDDGRHAIEVRARDGAALPGSPLTTWLLPKCEDVASSAHAVGAGFVALKPRKVGAGERRDVQHRDSHRDTLFDGEARRLIADLSRCDPAAAEALSTALADNEAETARRVAAFAGADEPLVSVVMPTFNRAFLIAQAIQSVVDQSWSNWELIVCDDGSTDKTSAVVHGFGDPRIRYLPLEKSNGAVARNFGLRFARGEFIAFLDTDNLWHPEFLRLSVAALSASAAPLCFTGFVDAVVKGARYASGAPRMTGFDYLALLERNAIDLNAIMLRAAVPATLGAFDERLKRVQDWDLLLRYALMFEPLAIPALGALYRRNSAWSQVTDLAGYTDDHTLVSGNALAALMADGASPRGDRRRVTIVTDSSNADDARLFAAMLGDAVDLVMMEAGAAPTAAPGDAVLVPHAMAVTAAGWSSPGAPPLAFARDGAVLRLVQAGGGDTAGFVIGRITEDSLALDGEDSLAPDAIGLAPSAAMPVLVLTGPAERAAWASALSARSRDGAAGLLVTGDEAWAFEHGEKRALASGIGALPRVAEGCHALMLAGADLHAAAPFLLRAARAGVPVIAADGPRPDALDAPADAVAALTFVDALASDHYTVAKVTARARRRFDYFDRTSRQRERTLAFLETLRAPRTEPPANRGSVPGLPRRPSTLAIKISAPTLATAQAWGDFHFANALRTSLQKLGWVARVDCRDAWEQGGDDVTLTLRGRNRYRGVAEALNLLWVISHPDRLTPPETADFAHVFVASDIFANVLKARTATPVSVLHQATDPSVFFPPSEPAATKAPALFVGNSRREYRAMVRWCVEAGIDVHVCGELWSGLIPERLILREHIGNAELHRWYGATPVLLNDHWDTMRAMGFLSNRLFDGSAAGAFIITDPVRGLAQVFGDAIETAADADELKDRVAFYLAHPQEARDKAERARAIVLAGHTFDDRAREIVAVCEAARRAAP